MDPFIPPSPFYPYKEKRNQGVVEKLLSTLQEIFTLVQEIESLNDFVRIVSSSSAVEASRSEELLKTFESLTLEIDSMVTRSKQTTIALEKSTYSLLFAVLEAAGVLLSEQARDIIDKIDRNLFERNCDCQAWATFPDNVNCLLDPTKENVEQASKLLSHICFIYEVYRDIILLNKEGTVVATANRPHLIGVKCFREEWFDRTIKGEVYVTDTYLCPLVGGEVVSYCAPVKDEKGNIIGVLSTRFNWDFVQEMLETARVADTADIHVISKKGTLIASRKPAALLLDTYAWLNCAQIVLDGYDGFSVEKSRNGSPMVVGGARTKGYNNYAGKAWSALVAQQVPLEREVSISRTLDPNNTMPIEKLDELVQVSIEESLEGESPAIKSDVANAYLLENAKGVQESIGQINKIHFETLLMSLNASVKSQHVGEEGRALSVISNEIRVISVRSKEITSKVNSALSDMLVGVNFLLQEKVKDAAWDAIDKVDRNLFERNCDVQAWTIFPEVIEAAKTGKKSAEVQSLLANLHRIYEIYDDIYLIDTSGKVVCAAIKESLVGHSFIAEDWFKETVRGQVTVTDMYFADTTNNHTVAYSAPVISDGRIVGVLTTRFNWNFIYDIIDKTLVPKGSKVYLLNSLGIVIASNDKEGILEKSFANHEAFIRAQGGETGVFVELDQESKKAIHYVGYAKTKGYNKYQGKGWTVLVEQPIKAN